MLPRWGASFTKQSIILDLKCERVMTWELSLSKETCFLAGYCWTLFCAGIVGEITWEMSSFEDDLGFIDCRCISCGWSRFLCLASFFMNQVSALKVNFNASGRRKVLKWSEEVKIQTSATPLRLGQLLWLWNSCDTTKSQQMADWTMWWQI